MISAMNVSAIRSDWVGRVVDGRFTLLQWLGGSEQSAVFRTEFPEAGKTRKAVIKLIPADAWDAEARLAGWQAAANLSHPSLMHLFATGGCDVDGFSMLYVVTEYAEEVLADILPERALSAEETGEMIGPVLDVLAWMHGKGLVHGHLKPANIMVVDDRLKLSVEGLRIAGHPGNPPPHPTIYEAPESASGAVNPEADLWSLGVTVVEALTQRRPSNPGMNQEDPVVPSSIPHPFAEIARGCLRSNPAQRFTIEDVRDQLGIGRPAPESSEVVAGKVPPLARLGILIVPVIVIGAVLAVREVSVHMRAQQVALSASEQPQGNPAAAQQKPAAATPAPEQAPAPAATTTEPSATAEPPATTAAQPDQAQPQPQTQAAAQTQPQAPVPAVSTPPAPAPAPSAQGSAPSNPEIVTQVMPDLLPAAVRSIHGKLNVKVKVTVDASGNVSDAEFESEGPSKYFSKAAMDAAQKWKFKPVPGTWILDFQFKQSGVEVTPTPASH